MKKSGTLKSKNSLAKAVIVSTLGFSLLLGGSTFALWNNSESLNNDTKIFTGDLKVTADEVQKWVDVTDEESPTVIDDLENYRLIPGGAIKLTQNIKAVVVGNNITGSLNVSIPNTTTGEALTQGVYTIVIKDSGGSEISSSTFDSVTSNGKLSTTAFDLKETGPEGSDFTVEVTVGLPLEADNQTKLQTINLGDMQITLDQTSS